MNDELYEQRNNLICALIQFIDKAVINHIYYYRDVHFYTVTLIGCSKIALLGVQK